MTTKFKKSFSPMLICWNDIKIHLGFEDLYFVPPPTITQALAHVTKLFPVDTGRRPARQFLISQLGTSYKIFVT